AARGLRRVRERAGREVPRPGTAEPVQGKPGLGRTEASVLALLAEPRLVRHDRLRRHRLGRLHQAVRPADPRPEAHHAFCSGGQGGVGMTMWGGRFSEGPSALLRALNDSFAFDRELFAEDVEGSIAWAKELGLASVLTSEEASALVDGLRSLTLVEGEYEDVHSF